MDLVHSLATHSSLVFAIIALVLGVICFLLYNATTIQAEELEELRETQKKLNRSFNELDEQAKLIVKTDLELNKAQEELERRLSGLNILQRASRQISMSLDEQDILTKLNQGFMGNLGFSKSLLLMYDKDKHIQAKVNVGYEDEAKLTHAMAALESNEHVNNGLQEGLAFSSQNTTQDLRSTIVELFEVEHFILSPIITQHGTIGMIFVGNRYNAPAITDGDEELIGILASQIGQSLEIAQLFEQVYRSRQDLEIKVRERTQQLEEALEDVKQINKKKSEFISAVSHELRTPLTSVKGYASLLMTGKIGDVPDAVRDRLAKINTHSDNLVQMINNLLDIARIESGRVEMNVKEHPVVNLVDNAHDLLMPQLKEKGVTFKKSLADDLRPVVVDVHQAERIFINLVSNAIKFTPENGVITVSAQNNDDDDYITFSVSDTGIGIKEDDLLKLFDEFYRVENEINMNVKGTGLGLALCKNIVAAHKGKIWVTSKVNLGTTFYFTLPCFDPRDKKEDEPAEPESTEEKTT